jgi:hypothetical protein
MWKFLRHPNIVPFIGVSPMFPICLVSEWMPNGDISQYLKAHNSADRVSFVIHRVPCRLYDSCLARDRSTISSTASNTCTRSTSFTET